MNCSPEGLHYLPLISAHNRYTEDISITWNLDGLTSKATVQTTKLYIANKLCLCCRHFGPRSRTPRLWVHSFTFKGRWSRSNMTFSTSLLVFLHGKFCHTGGTSGKEPTCQCKRSKRSSQGGKAGQPTPVFLPRESHQRSLEGYNP